MSQKPFLFPPWLRGVFGDSVQYRPSRVGEPSGRAGVRARNLAAGLDEDGWEVANGSTPSAPPAAAPAPAATATAGGEFGQEVMGFEEYLRALERNGGLEGLAFEENDDGELEVTYNVDADMEGVIDEHLQELIRRGLVEDISNGSSSSDDTSSDDIYSDEGGDSESGESPEESEEEGG